jgi:hypothetical protein
MRSTSASTAVICSFVAAWADWYCSVATRIPRELTAGPAPRSSGRLSEAAKSDV